MRVNVTGHINVTGDCGHKFEVPIAGFEDEFECPVCGAKDRFTEEQIASFKEQINTSAGEFATEHVAERLRSQFKDMARRSKHIKYRPK